jgi:hypothetical protein
MLNVTGESSAIGCGEGNDHDLTAEILERNGLFFGVDPLVNVKLWCHGPGRGEPFGTLFGWVIRAPSTGTINVPRTRLAMLSARQRKARFMIPRFQDIRKGDSTWRTSISERGLERRNESVTNESVTIG